MTIVFLHISHPIVHSCGLFNCLINPFIIIILLLLKRWTSPCCRLFRSNTRGHLWMRSSQHSVTALADLADRDENFTILLSTVV